MARTEWLSEGAEKLAFELVKHDKPGEAHCDIAVVGSGYGGAVAAARLAGAWEEELGRKAEVWVLERGREFVPGSFPERFADLPGEVRIGSREGAETRGLRQGLFDVRIGEDVSALLANGLGGGSLINAGVLARPSERLLQREEWLEFADGALNDYFDKAEAMLGGTRLPGRAPTKLAALQQLGARIDDGRAERARIAVTFHKGLSGAGVPQEACIHCGDCFTGCNHWAKNTLAMNYLPLARRRGARLITGITVLSVQPVLSAQPGQDQEWELQLEFTEREVGQRFNEGNALPRLRARRVILAAGAYGSTGILLRSADRGFAALSRDQIGRHFSTNGDMIAVGHGMPAPVQASATEALAPGERKVGPTITGMIDLRERFEPFVIEELAIPAPLRRAFEEVVTTFGGLHSLERIDWSDHSREPSRDPAAIDPDEMARTAVYATIGDDGAGGTIKLRPDAIKCDDGVLVEWKDVGKAPVFAEAMKVLEEAHGDRATLIPNPMWRLLPAGMGQVLEGGDVGGAVLTVHPLGGCAMAAKAEKGVVNALGQVFKGAAGSDVHQSLVVLDGAMVPTALGTNPCLTIAALAEHAVEKLATKWALRRESDDPGEIDRLPKLREPRRPDPAPWTAPRPTAMRLAERLTGELKLDGQKFDARLELEYRELPDLERFLSRPLKVLPIEKARLELRGTLGDEEVEVTLRLTGELRMFEREATTVFDRVRSAGRAWWANRGRRELTAFLKGLPARLWAFLTFRKAPPAVSKKKPGIWKRVKGWFALASQVGERRLMSYVLRVEDGTIGPLKRGSEILGTKRIEYIAAAGRDGPWPTPWDQLTKLPLRLPGAGLKDDRLGWLEVDLPYFVQHHATQLQVGSQEDQPRAIADLYSLFAYILRVIGKIHIWSLRAPDYPDPYPIYAFDKASRVLAATRAKQVVNKVQDRRRYRLPGPMKGFKRRVLRLDPNNRQGTRLTHYTLKMPPQQALGPVLLIHGLGAGGNTFTLPTVNENLVQHLAKRGFDPWVLDLSTSIGLPSSKAKDWSFEEVAGVDIPAAIERVRAESGSQQIYVVAHCIGAAMFSMAALDRKFNPEWIKGAVLSQVGPLLELPPTNRFRGYVASYFKYYLNIDEFDTVSTLSPFSRFLDRLLAGALPYPWYEWDAHRSIDKPLTHESYCVRAYGIYGRLFEHAHLNDATLEHLGDYLGHIRYKTYQQTIYYATMRRLTDSGGANLVSYGNIRERLNFPICFLHGMKNEVFDKRTSERSFDLLASIFWPEDLKRLWQENPDRRYKYSLYSTGKTLRIVEVPNYGHQDCMIGHRAHKTVYPRISAFLEECQPLAKDKPLAALIVVRPPRLGPIVGWVRESEDKKNWMARVLLMPNDARSKPARMMSIVLKNGAPLHARFHPLGDSKAGAPVTEAIDVLLPTEEASYAVVVVTLHEEQYEPEPVKDVGEPRGDDPFGEDLDRIPVGFAKLPPADQTDASPYMETVLATCKDLRRSGGIYVPIPTGARVSHRRYAKPVSAAILAPEVLQAAREREKPESVSFALASCRYAATFADREAADAAFGRLREVLAARVPCTPHLLFLAGDSIYADATYGVFDPQAQKDRFDERYLEVWSAPNAREVLRSVPTYPMLDDHEVCDGFEGRPPKHKPGLDAFERFQLRLTPRFENPTRSSLNGGHYWYEAAAGGYGFFVADTRTDRRRASGLESANALIMGDDQVKALQHWLKKMQDKDPEMPKFVVSPSVVAPWSRETRGDRRYSLRSDAWDGFPSSLHELLGFIVREGISNVVFLSGDYHCSVFCRMALRQGGGGAVPAYSIVSSGLYAPYPFANTRFDDLEERFAGTYASWLGEQGDGGLTIEYHAQRIDTRSSFACVVAERSGTEYALTVSFDTEPGLPQVPPIRVPLSGVRAAVQRAGTSVLDTSS